MKDKMYKFILVVLVGGFAFSGTFDDFSVSISEDNLKKEVCEAEKAQDNVDRRRRGKGSKGRRRGGSGLR